MKSIGLKGASFAPTLGERFEIEDAMAVGPEYSADFAGGGAVLGVDLEHAF